jgi:hypothetical protein
MGARYVFVKGPFNSLDGAMVGRYSPSITVPGEYEALYEPPNRAKFAVIRPLKRGDCITMAVYMPRSGVAQTMKWTRDSTLLASRVLSYTTWFAVAIGVVGVLSVVIVLILVLGKRGPPQPPPRLS